MTIREAEEFIASVLWRAVKMVELGDTGKTPDPHEYVIKGWREVDTNLFDASVRMIKVDGYRGGQVSRAVLALALTLALALALALAMTLTEQTTRQRKRRGGCRERAPCIGNMASCVLTLSPAPCRMWRGVGAPAVLAPPPVERGTPSSPRADRVACGGGWRYPGLNVESRALPRS